MPCFTREMSPPALLTVGWVNELVIAMPSVPLLLRVMPSPGTRYLVRRVGPVEVVATRETVDAASPPAAFCRVTALLTVTSFVAASAANVMPLPAQSPRTPRLGPVSSATRETEFGVRSIESRQSTVCRPGMSQGYPSPTGLRVFNGDLIDVHTASHMDAYAGTGHQLPGVQGSP